MKKIICLLLCAAMVLGVAGCMRQTPETAIHNYFKEIKKTVTLTLGLKVDSEQSLAVVEKFFENFSYEIAGIQEDGEDKTFATLKIHNIDTGTAVKNTLTEYFAFALTTIFHPLSDEEMEAKFYEIFLNHLNKAEMITKEVVLEMHYVNDKWEINMTEAIADTIIGGFTTYMDYNIFD